MAKHKNGGLGNGKSLYSFFKKEKKKEKRNGVTGLGFTFLKKKGERKDCTVVFY